MQKAQGIKDRIFQYCYNTEDAFFYDVDKHGKQRKYLSCAIFHLFLEGVLDRKQDRAVIDAIYKRHIKNPEEFWTAYPFPAVSSGDPRWVQNLPGNSWGFYSQGLTALRTLRWMPALGRTDDMEEIMRRWVSAWSRSTTTLFGQELHPLTGEPSKCSQWYSSCMLYFLHAIRRLYDI